MPCFRVEQYELHISTYYVEAESKAEAVQQVFSGECESEKTEFCEIAENYGLPVEKNQELADELEVLEVTYGEDIIESLRSVEECGPPEK